MYIAQTIELGIVFRVYARLRETLSRSEKGLDIVLLIAVDPPFVLSLKNEFAGPLPMNQGQEPTTNS
jgi:hypothetical protein